MQISFFYDSHELEILSIHVVSKLIIITIIIINVLIHSRKRFFLFLRAGKKNWAKLAQFNFISRIRIAFVGRWNVRWNMEFPLLAEGREIISASIDSKSRGTKEGERLKGI